MKVCLNIYVYVYKVSWPIIYGQSFGQQLYCICKRVFDLFFSGLQLMAAATGHYNDVKHHKRKHSKGNIRIERKKGTRN